MSTVATTPAVAPPAPAQPATRRPRPVVMSPRRLLGDFALTLLVPLAALAALLAGWTWASATGWPAAAGATAGWAAVVGMWLRHRGWRWPTVHLVTWAGPVALLAPLAGLGWLSADGTVLWAPLSCVLAVAISWGNGPPSVHSVQSRSVCRVRR